MPEKTVSTAKTLPPYIRSADSVARRSWGQVAALIPVFVAACFTGHAEVLRILLICLVSAVAFEFLSARFFGKKADPANGQAVLAASLFTLLMPSRCPSEIMILGVFFATVMARETFGGMGSYLFHPLLLARAFLQICFPKAMAEPMLFAGAGSIWVFAALVLDGIIFLKQKQGYWETPVLFMTVCFFCEALLGGKEVPIAFFSAVLFAAIFLLADPVALPLTRKGTTLFVLGTALLSFCSGAEGFSIQAVCFAVLLMNLLTPWLDVLLKPIPYKAKTSSKEICL